ncbi:MAG TPA: hypothetical protein PLO33_10820 [Kouleothrix sp.]|nr:hypothetical protein [Kouleothrix sp.]HRC76161.1 hypothetical protein [Kouleothrix sp.]
MAISANALTMAQYAIISNAPMVEAVTNSLIDNGSIMARDIPFVDKATLLANGVRWEGNLPTVNWSQINAEGTSTSGTPTPYQEQAYIIRNVIDVDKFLVLDQNQIVDPRVAQLQAYLKAVAYDFNDKFFNNNHTAGNTDAVVGIRARIDNGSTFGVRSENKINGSGVDLTTAATAATFSTFLELVDQLLWSVDSPTGAGVVLYASDQLQRRWDRLARQFSGQGGFATAQDQLGREVLRYKAATIQDPGLKADQSTRILTSTETSAGANGSSNYVSLYAVNYSTDHFFGWQFAAMQAADIGLLEAGSTYRTLIDWAGGLMNASTRSLGRVYGIKYS